MLSLPPYTSLGYRDTTGVLINKENNLKYILADHIIGGFEYIINRDSRVTLEGFYKDYKDYPFSVVDSISLANKGGDFGAIGDEEVTSTSQGRAYGFEISGRYTFWKICVRFSPIPTCAASLKTTREN